MKKFTIISGCQPEQFRCSKKISAESFEKALFCSFGLTLLISLSSCKDDSAPLPDLKSQTYTSSSLSLTYDGEQMPGKSARVEISGLSQNEKKANITFYSEFDLSQLSGMGLTGSIAGPGVLPGSSEINIPVDLIPGDGCYTFSGSGATESIEYKYSGSLRSDILEMNFEDCKLKSQVYAGKVFSPAPIKKEGLVAYSSLPFHLVWELDPTSEIDIPLSEILKGIMTAPIIPVYQNTAYTSVAQLFESGVQTIALNPDGNIPVVYMSTVGGAAHLATSCGNMLQYVPASGGLKVYVNPLSALSQALVALSKPSTDAEFVTKATDSSGSSSGVLAGIDPKVVNAVVKALVAAIEPQLKDGIYLTLASTSDGVDVYFNTQESVTFISVLIENLLKEPAIATALQQYLASLQLQNISKEELAGILNQLPGFLEKTTKLEIGLSLVNYQAK